MTDTTAPTSTGRIEHLDPATLAIEDNVRSSGHITDDFLDSIRQHGVLSPVLAHRSIDGTVTVRAGQRRTLAARTAGLATIPVYVTDSAQPDTVTRIVQQVIENDQRAGLSTTDRVAAWQQLAFEGLTPAAIARRTSTPKADVQHGLTAASSDTARTALDTGISLAHAAALTEFDDDPGTAADLAEVAATDPDLFDHALQRARDDRARTAVRAAAIDALRADGWTVIDREATWATSSPWIPVHRLTTADGNPATAEDLAGLEPRAATVDAWGGQAHISHYAHRDNLDRSGLTGPARPDTTSGRDSGPMSEEQKADRRTLIANNKAWESAQTVRRDWLTTFLTRKSLPKDIGGFIAAALTTHRHRLGDALTRGNTLAATLLGATGPDPLRGWLTANPTRAGHLTAAICLAGIEDTTSRNDWRYPDPATAAYLARLVAWGYTASDVEQIILDAHPSPTA